MNRMFRPTATLVLIACLVLATPALAVEKNGGIAASYIQPTDLFDKIANGGYGISVIFDYPLLGVFDATGSLGWYRFGGVTLIEGTNLETDSTNVWEVVVGPQVELGKLYLGVEGGYWTKIDEWGIMPNVGLRKDLVDLGFRYKVTGEGTFYAIRLGFFF